MASRQVKPPEYVMPDSNPEAYPGGLITISLNKCVILWVCLHCVLRSPNSRNLEQHGHPYIGLPIKLEEQSAFASRPELAALAVMKLRPCDSCGENSWADVGMPKADAPDSLKGVRGKLCRKCGYVQSWKAGLK